MPFVLPFLLLSSCLIITAPTPEVGDQWKELDLYVPDGFCNQEVIRYPGMGSSQVFPLRPVSFNMELINRASAILQLIG